MKKTQKKTVTSNKKPIKSKKRFLLSPLQKKLSIAIGIIVLIGGIAGAFALYQNNEADAAGCMSKRLTVGVSSICTSYFLQVVKANGTNSYKDSKGTHVVQPGSAFGPKASAVAKRNGISDGTINSANDWKKVCNLALSSIKSGRKVTAYAPMGCAKSSVSALRSKTRCVLAGWKDYYSNACQSTTAAPNSDKSETQASCKKKMGRHWSSDVKNYGCLVGPSSVDKVGALKKEDCTYWNYRWSATTYFAGKTGFCSKSLPN
ncbi:MAG: hypothetical protein WBB94_01380 [Candidatus Saccharimonadaceae bacterium]